MEELVGAAVLAALEADDVGAIDEAADVVAAEDAEDMIGPALVLL